MTVIFVLVPVATFLALTAVVGFIWSAKKGQMDDLETPALRVLHDDE